MSSINTNIAALGAYRNLSTTTMNLNKSIEKLSSGFRINHSSDDAAGSAIANGLRSDGRSLSAAQRNAQQAGAVLNIVDGAVNTVSTILDRMKELAATAASSNSGSTARTNLDAEFQQLVLEVDRIAGTTKYQGTTLTNGSGGTLTFLVSSSGQYSTNDTVTFTASAVDIRSTTLFGTTTAQSLTTLALAQTALTNIDTSITNLGTSIGVVGAAQSRIQFASANVASILQNTLAAESTIRDTDMAAEMTNFTKNQVLAQAGTAMLAQANSLPQSILTLLKG